MRRTIARSVLATSIWLSGALLSPGADAQGADAPSTEPPSASAAPAPDGMDAGTYAVRLRDLEQRVNELKEEIFRSKARLSLLAETVLEGVVGGGQAMIVHENRMSDSYKLVRVVYALDGAPIFTKADEEGILGGQEEFEVYNGSIVYKEIQLEGSNILSGSKEMDLAI